MEDFPSHQVQALSAHVDGLEAALAALPDDPEMGASLRRIARSLSATAAEIGAEGLADAARRIRDADDRSLEAAARRFLADLEAVSARSSSGSIRVLLVEDSRTVAAAVTAYLGGPNFTVLHAEDAAQAEELLASRSVDIVLLDLILPDRDGRDLLVRMRESRATADVPVVVMSAKGGAVPRAECLAVGACEFLEKPVDPKVLRAAVTQHARPPRANGSAERAAPSRVPGRAALVEAYEPLRIAADRGTTVAVALLAVDDYPAILETLGDDRATALVAALVAPIAEGLEGREMAGRWGRSELVVLLPHATKADAEQKLRAGLARLAASERIEEVGRAGLDLSFSAGIALAEGAEDLREVVSAAEQSLHRARALGRGVLVGPDDREPDRPRRVMLVEDDRVTATLIHHRLEREGFEVMDFSNGEDAYEWAADAAFDLAILDVKVPGMDGFELLERLRSIGRLDSVPIVMLTGLGGEADVIRGLELGANDYMLKPFSPTELLARVRRLVFGGTAGASGAGGPSGATAEATTN